MLILENVSKQFAGSAVSALSEVSLEIAQGAIFGILGRSGAGKSTLLRCLNLLERPSEGRILIDGQDITKLNLAALRKQRQQMGI